MLRKHLHTLVIVLSFAFIAAACGGGTGEVSRHVRDHKAYSLGQEHAGIIISLRDNESSLQDALLDIRARITNIHDRVGAQAAADYERGFVDYITEKDDSLARVLF
ncbi:MAG: hypothetical protein K2K77_03890 [Duncaniella sp.]|nr:hypothetical protein [Duncaniella sp.]